MLACWEIGARGPEGAVSGSLQARHVRRYSRKARFGESSVAPEFGWRRNPVSWLVATGQWSEGEQKSTENPFTAKDAAEDVEVRRGKTAMKRNEIDSFCVPLRPPR
jgi:hypothetical protein